MVGKNVIKIYCMNPFSIKRKKEKSVATQESSTVPLAVQ